MFLFNIHAVAQDDSIKKEAGWAGAFVQSIVDFKIEAGAELLAMTYIKEQGWIPCETEEVRMVAEEDYVDNPDLLANFKEAEEHGCAFEFFTYPEEEIFWQA